MTSHVNISTYEHQTSAADSYVFFWKVRDSYGELSQWYNSHFKLNDKPFANAEQFMMYAKAEIFGDTRTAYAILRTITSHPADHRRMGRMVRNFDEDTWSRVSMNVAVVANLCKFTHDDRLMGILMSTDGKTLVEASPTDSIWGIGFTERNAFINSDRWGTNKLGKALTIVRDMVAYRLAHGITNPFTNTSELTDMCSNMDTGEFNPTGMFV
jgi:ribA/ribD-fused uncharacterized protein